MPTSLKLYLRALDPPQTVWFRRPGGVLDSLPSLRLIAYANFLRVLRPGRPSGPFAITECIVDTGAHFSIVAERLWRRFLPGVVTPLPFDALTPPHLRTTSIAGGTYPYELGELTIQFEDQNRSALSVTVVAKLTRDGGKLPLPITLGLRGGLLEGRNLTAASDPAVPFGQAWELADP
jgi:hypothetical protein